MKQCFVLFLHLHKLAANNQVGVTLLNYMTVCGHSKPLSGLEEDCKRANMDELLVILPVWAVCGYLT